MWQNGRSWHPFNTHPSIAMSHSTWNYRTHLDLTWIEKSEKLPELCREHRCIIFLFVFVILTYIPVRINKPKQIPAGSNVRVWNGYSEMCVQRPYTQTHPHAFFAWGDSSQTAWFRRQATGKRECLAEKGRGKIRRDEREWRTEDKTTDPISYPVKWTKSSYTEHGLILINGDVWHAGGGQQINTRAINLVLSTLFTPKEEKKNNKESLLIQSCQHNWSAFA